MLTVLVLALSNLLLIELVRALPLPTAWKQRKPLSCDVCMSGWAAIGALIALGSTQGRGLNLLDALDIVGGGGLTLLFLIVLVTPRRSPPEWE